MEKMTKEGLKKKIGNYISLQSEGVTLPTDDVTSRVEKIADWLKSLGFTIREIHDFSKVGAGNYGIVETTEVVAIYTSGYVAGIC